MRARYPSSGCGGRGFRPVWLEFNALRADLSPPHKLSHEVACAAPTLSRMSAVPPIATELIHRRELTRCARNLPPWIPHCKTSSHKPNKLWNEAAKHST